MMIRTLKTSRRPSKNSLDRKGGGGVLSRSFDLLNLMIYDLKRSVDLRWLFWSGATFIFTWYCYHFLYISPSLYTIVFAIFIKISLFLSLIDTFCWCKRLLFDCLICAYKGSWKERIFYGQADRKGRGGQPPRPWLGLWNRILESLKVGCPSRFYPI